MSNITIVFLSSFLTNSKSQITMVLTIISLGVLLSIYMFLISNILWFSLMLLLIYISGIIVLFMFIVSLTPNENTLLNTNSNQTIVIIICLAWIGNSFFSSNELNINSYIEWSLIIISLTVIVILIIGYLPPNIISSFYSGISSTN